MDTKDSYDVTITKENYFLYELFEDLYDSVKNGIIKTYPSDDENETIPALKCEVDRLFKDNSIIYLSDNFIDEEASSFEIRKEEEKFKITFNKSKSNSLFNTFAVRITNSGSRYGYFNVLFMNMYNKLIEYKRDNYHQIHIEEVVYSLKQKRK